MDFRPLTQNSDQTLPNLYLTCYADKFNLIRFLKQFGFFEHSQRPNNELVFLKQFVPKEQDLTALSSLEFHVRFGPYQIREPGRNTFVVPIQPKWHKLLFPNLEQQMNLFAGGKACGNSILKAYLCNSSIKTIPPGSVLLFYRSQDSSSIQAIGVVDDCIRSSSATEIAQFVGKRTVYSLEAINEMCQKETLAILFRYAIDIEPIQLGKLIENEVLTGVPQQITRIKSDGAKWIKELIEQ